ncbi:IclR family transcriptional regulator [Rhodococcus sp. 06-235-1A]|uniref:IclR family transcriptional regulator domain-containing protein n=1 Tax=Rhodococcus sp. 06-235-1A TaxID=2022508 RepID=UPI000B9BFC10|nr:IclR family transcriptional regulator C-terminal domain-containing protein [Rhodococcus sp. 06-235-1A]OZD04853.1 IclR family transcriptional regulator [Rhodococcus sp. 06-235-1A]
MTAEIAPDDQRPAWFVQSLERGLSVLQCFDDAHPARTLTEVAEAVGVTRATARRLLLTLAELGFVRQDGRQFTLTPRVMNLGFSFLSGMDLPRLAEPHIEALARQLGETTSVAILDGFDIVYVARVPSSRMLRVVITLGTRFPAHATSSGRVLLAALPESELERYFADAPIEALTPRTIVDRDALRTEIARVRSAGWSEVVDELDVGMRAAAVPLRNSNGTVVAALNTSLHAKNYTAADMVQTVIPAMLDTAVRIRT